MDPLVKKQSHIQSIANKHATTPLLLPEVESYISKLNAYAEDLEKI